MKRRVCVILPAAVFALAGCSTVPEPLQGDFPDLRPAEVGQSHVGSRVRWGGSLIETRPQEAKTCFEILARPLSSSSSRPRSEGPTRGRFIACKQGFRDPAVFKEGAEVTVTGRINRIEPGMIGDYEYRYPVLDPADTVYLWKERRNTSRYYQPYPFYYPDPFYPFYYPRYYYGFGYHVPGHRYFP